MTRRFIYYGLWTWDMNINQRSGCLIFPSLNWKLELENRETAIWRVGVLGGWGIKMGEYFPEIRDQWVWLSTGRSRAKAKMTDGRILFRFLFIPPVFLLDLPYLCFPPPTCFFFGGTHAYFYRRRDGARREGRGAAVGNGRGVCMVRSVWCCGSLFFLPDYWKSIGIGNEMERRGMDDGFHDLWMNETYVLRIYK